MSYLSISELNEGFRKLREIKGVNFAFILYIYIYVYVYTCYFIDYYSYFFRKVILNGCGGSVNMPRLTPKFVLTAALASFIFISIVLYNTVESNANQREAIYNQVDISINIDINILMLIC